MKRYTGERTIDGISVLVDGEPLSPRADQLKLTDYGFEWSYEGPEPSQLAFAILFEHLGNAAEAKKEPLSELHAADCRQFRTTRKMTSADIDAAIVALRGERAA